MQEFLSNLYSNSSVPALSALFLGLLTAISPCPMTINITAIGFIGKDIGSRKRIFFNGIVYVAGRMVAYAGLAMAIYYGADQFSVSSFFQQYGEKIAGPVLLIIGLLMLGIVNINLTFFGRLTEKYQVRRGFRYIDVFLLGILLALAFCPYGGALYFGMLIPLTITSGLHLPVIFAIASGVPVIIFAWLIAYTISGVGSFYNSLKSFEFWFRRLVGLVFIGIGVYYIAFSWF